MMAGVITLKDLHFLEFSGKLSVLSWCQKIGLMTSAVRCEKCGDLMNMIERHDVSDGYEWACKNRRWEGHRGRRSVRAGSFFSLSAMPTMKIVLVCYMWVHRFPNRDIVRELNLSGTSLSQWKKMCREVCVYVCLNNNVPCGGPGVIVDLDVSEYGEREFKKGRQVEGDWVIGGVERGTGKSFFAVVQVGSAESLINVISDWILPGTTIVSDCWDSQECRNSERFEDLRENGGYVFKEPESGHSKSMSDTWHVVKKTAGRKSEDNVDSYFMEYAWRKAHKNSEDLFYDFLQAVKELYDPSAPLK